ncbi:MAG: PQQ-binding-like beta-propeller repeat protein [Bauldia sp.]|nr:PQQ-binding-like beta-propeller repeat protein [Bauldia sp.]
MRHLKALLLGSVSIAIMAGSAAAQDDPFASFTPVTDEMLQNPPAEDWLSWRATLNHWGYSPLDQINRDNVDDIEMVWSRAITEGFVEGAPLVHDGVMFVPHPADVIQALDATNGDLLWEYRRELPDDVPAIIVTRGLAIWENLILLQSKDNFLVALDATTGQLVWETQIRSPDNWSWSTQGPIIANGKAISGRSCSQQNGPGGAEGCFLTAHDLATGEELWRFYTIPQQGQPGSETWGDAPYETWHHVGSWLTPSFDPELNLVYFGTSVTSPYAKFYFAEPDELDNEFLYQTSTLAIDADTGELVWYQQHIRDQWDLDHPFERILVDTVIAPNPDEVRWINPNVTPGEERQVLTGIPGKTGIFYSIDRATGEFLWARETTYQNVISDIDLTTGRATHPIETIPTEIGQQIFICPAANGGKGWHQGAFSPLTNTIYYPLHNSCMNTLTTDTDIQLNPREISPGEDHLGNVFAVNVETGETEWVFETRAAHGSLVTTGGGLIFGGDLNRRFHALDQETGEVLWEVVLSSPVNGTPISYAVDGRQYVAVSVGGALNSAGLLGQTPELRPGTGGNTLYVFALDE